MIRTGYFSKKRARILYLLLIGFVAIQFRLIYIQFYKHEHYKEKAIQQSTNFATIPAERGRILDREGKVIAESYLSKSIFTDPTQIKDQEKLEIFIDKASKVLGKSKADLKKACQKKSQFVWLARNLNFKQSQDLESLVKDTRGIYFRDEWTRFYRSGNMMAPIVGIVGTEHQGLTGLEQRYDKILKGQNGKERQIRNAKRKVLYQEVIEEPQSGKDVKLTLDMGIQTFLFNELAKGYNEFSPEVASGIVMDVTTGEILGIATLPAHTPGERVPRDLEGLKPRMVRDVFEPGSTMKPLIYAACIDDRKLDPQEVVHCGHGKKRFGRRVINDYHPYGELTMEQVIIKSSNIGSAMMGIRLGNKRLYDLMTNLGFGEKIYLPLSGESRGILRPYKKWDTYSTTSIPMGHEIAVTMPQMLKAWCALGNGGYVIQPSLEMEIRDEKGEVLRSGGIGFTEGRAFSAKACRETLKALQLVVEKGTGRRAISKLYSIGGKTGTTEKLIDGQYAKNNQNIASFIGLAPIERPRIAVMIVMDGATVYKATGGKVAAPVAKNVIDNVLQYMGVPPNKPEDES